MCVRIHTNASNVKTYICFFGQTRSDQNKAFKNCSREREITERPMSTFYVKNSTHQSNRHHAYWFIDQNEFEKNQFFDHRRGSLSRVSTPPSLYTLCTERPREQSEREREETSRRYFLFIPQLTYSPEKLPRRATMRSPLRYEASVSAAWC